MGRSSERAPDGALVPVDEEALVKQYKAALAGAEGKVEPAEQLRLTYELGHQMGANDALRREAQRKEEEKKNTVNSRVDSMWVGYSPMAISKVVDSLDRETIPPEAMGPRNGRLRAPADELNYHKAAGAIYLGERMHHMFLSNDLPNDEVLAKVCTFMRYNLSPEYTPLDAWAGQLRETVTMSAGCIRNLRAANTPEENRNMVASASAEYLQKVLALQDTLFYPYAATENGRDYLRNDPSSITPALFGTYRLVARALRNGGEMNNFDEVYAALTASSSCYWSVDESGNPTREELKRDDRNMINRLRGTIVYMIATALYASRIAERSGGGEKAELYLAPPIEANFERLLPPLTQYFDAHDPSQHHGPAQEIINTYIERVAELYRKRAKEDEAANTPEDAAATSAEHMRTSEVPPTEMFDPAFQPMAVLDGVAFEDPAEMSSRRKPRAAGEQSSSPTVTQKLRAAMGGIAKTFATGEQPVAPSEKPNKPTSTVETICDAYESQEGLSPRQDNAVVEPLQQKLESMTARIDNVPDERTRNQLKYRLDAIMALTKFAPTAKQVDRIRRNFVLEKNTPFVSSVCQQVSTDKGQYNVEDAVAKLMGDADVQEQLTGLDPTQFDMADKEAYDLYVELVARLQIDINQLSSQGR
ncbi:hypothetical protein CR983_01240 [Candidatus Saccharibacteria bacterium]|nr:MAG: hypothetical protein CR983_01240 [Candidatus Saccharibacteria bacterium]